MIAITLCLPVFQDQWGNTFSIQQQSIFLLSNTVEIGKIVCHKSRGVGLFRHIDPNLSAEIRLWQSTASGTLSNVECYEEKTANQTSHRPLLLRGATEHTVIRA